MNSHERAVIDAAREVGRKVGFAPDEIDMLIARVRQLENYERDQASAGTSEIEWSLVVAGDEIRGRSGAFFPVIRTRQEVEMGKYTGRHVLEVGLPGGPRSIIRPVESEPFATVRRGPDGTAVDEFLQVLSSGGQ